MREATARGPQIDLGEFERRLRAPAPAAAPAAKTDPLGELARLMQGGPEGLIDDPYSRVLGAPAAAPRGSAPQWPAPPEAAPQAGHADYDDAFAGGLRGSLDAHAPQVEAPRNLDMQWADQQNEAAGAAYAGYGYAEDLYAQRNAYAQPQPPHAASDWPQPGYSEYAYGPEDGDYDGAEDSEYRGFLGRFEFRPWHAVSAIALIGLVSIGWGFAHRSGVSGSREIATINAPEGPVKVAPAAEPEAKQEGAAILDRKEGSQVKGVVSHEEQAVDPKVAPRAVQLGNGPVDARHEPPALAPPEARRVKTVSVRPDGTLIRDDRAPSAAIDSPSARDHGSAKGATPVSPAKPATTPKTAAKPKVETAAAVDGAAAAAAPAKAVSAGTYSVQFGAAGSEAEARGLMTKVAGKYGSALGGRKPTFKPATVDGKAVYRVRVGGVSKESATAICEKVKTSGGSCFVAGN